MKAFRILSKNIDESFKGVFRNFSLSMASIVCITITLVLVGFSILLSYNVNHFTSAIESDMTIVVFIDRKATDLELSKVRTELDKLDNVKEIKFNSKESIRKDMQGESEVFNSIMSEYTKETNPLQDTYLVKVEDINKIASTAKKIKAIDGVDIIKYGEGMVEQLVAVFDVVRKICLGMVVALIVVTAFLISNTIKITIFSRKREIEIMRLVGASNLNIKIPFIFEGLFLGVIGSIIPIIATIYGYTVLFENFNGQLFSPFIKLVEPQPFIFLLSLVLVVIGILVGMFGSWRAVKKYLKI